MHESLTSFAVEVGTEVASCLLEDDVVKLCGEKSQRVLNRAHNRHGTQPGYIVLGGQKVAIRRPRVRSLDDKEVPLDVYAKLQSEDAMPQAALAKMYQFTRFDNVNYSVPRQCAFQSVIVKAYVDRVEIVHQNVVVATHVRSYSRGDQVLDPLAFSDWGQIFQGERMTAALLDRLTHHSEIFEMNGESFRFKESMKQKQQPGSQD